MVYEQNILYYRCASTNYEHIHSVTVPATAKPSEIAKNYKGNKNYRLVKLTDSGHNLIHEFNRGKKNYSVHTMCSKNGFYTGNWITCDSNVLAKTPREALRLGAPITTRLLSERRPTVTRPHPGMIAYEFDNVKYAVAVCSEQ
jgi:hypothetical protein